MGEAIAAPDLLEEVMVRGEGEKVNELRWKSGWYARFCMPRYCGRSPLLWRRAEG